MPRPRPPRAKGDYRDGIVEDVRPWGRFRSFPLRSVTSVKIITVAPGSGNSLQYHGRRDEYWVILDRGLEVTIGGRRWRARPGEEIFVPRRTPHRMRCPGRKPARVMELWLGRSSEDDIVRLADDYGRAGEASRK